MNISKNYGIVHGLSNEMKQLLLEAVVHLPVNIGIFCIDKNYNYLLFNELYENYIKNSFGVTVKLGDNYLETFSEYQDIVKEKATIDQALQGVKFDQIGHYYYKNKKHYYKDTYKPVTDKNGNIVGTIVYYRNITSKKKQELTWSVLLNISRKSQKTDDLKGFIADVRDELSKIIDTSNFFVALYNKERNRYSFPYYKDEHDNINIYEQYNLSDSSTDYVRQTGKILLLGDEKTKKMAKENHIKLYGTNSPSWLGVPLKTDNGVIGVLVIQNYKIANRYTAEDIDILTFISGHIANTIERKQSKEKLNKTARILKRAIKIARLGYMKIKKDSELIHLTEEICEILGLETDCMQMNFVEFNELIYKKDSKNFNEFIKKITKVDVLYEFEFRIVNKKTKQIVYLSVKAELLEHEYPLDSEINILAQDITNQHNDRLELKEAKEKAEKSDKLKGAFLSNMSHEIRTPMNAILGFSEFLTERNLPEENTIKYAKYISQSAKDLLQIINDILDIAKIEAGEIKIKKESFDLHQMLWETKLIFETTAINKKKSHIDFNLFNAIESEKLYINSDRVRLKQILINLLNNAFKFTLEGHIYFGYRIENEGRIEFFVKDSGQGIPEEKKELVFSRFGQLIDDKIMHPGGTGLGLSITKSLVKNLGGDIDFKSKMGEGTEFIFHLPYKTSGIKQEKEEYNIDPGSIRGKVLIIADQNALNRKLIGNLLKEYSPENEFIFAQNGKETLELAKEKKPDIIIANMEMPDIKSCDFVNAFRNLEEPINQIPLLALTSYVSEEKSQEALKMGISCYISKPYNFENIYTKIVKHLK